MEKRRVKKSVKWVSLGVLLVFCFLLGIFLSYVTSIKPELVLKGDNPYYLEVGSKYNDPGFEFINTRKKEKYLVVINEAIDNYTLGDYEVSYKYLDNEITRKVRVVDRTSPVISLVGNEEAIVCQGKKYQEEGYKVTDNYDKGLTDKVVVKAENDYILYEVEDSSGNGTSLKRKIVYKDETKPKLKINTSKTIYLGDKLSDKVTAIDNCDGDISNKIKIRGEVNTKKVGSYKRIYEVADASGNKVEQEVVISVKERPVYKNRTIYLTFDDGPSLNVTPSILDTLKKYNIKATFFVLNHGSDLDRLLLREFNEGHTIGYHGNSHSYEKIYKNEEAFIENIRLIEDKVVNLTNYNSKVIRFPGGSSNTISRDYNKGIMGRLTKKVEKLGYQYFDWNVGSSDTVTQNPQKICKNVIRGLGSGTNVVLMHDAKDKKGTAKALSCIIEYGLKNGYSFDKITSKTPSVHHGVNN